ncbi:MAG: sulfite exporter TauE/SafE family protein [Bacteroidia bacterium]|nr:sulfite exporter TauE/SafE family protein [Bacteroidia bacterium]MBP7261256.1 sulfite exporter TauE/SafE family protein [Bacteroidia bacterium]
MRLNILFLLAAFLCEILGTIGGFGSSVFFVPIAGFFFSFNMVLAITGILHVFSNVNKLLLFRNSIDKKLLQYYGIPSVLLVLAGSYLSTHTSFELAELTLAFFLVIFSATLLMLPNLQLPATRNNALLSGALAGLLAGFNGTGGAIRGISMAAFNLEKNTFVATSAAVDLGVDVSRSAVYLGFGYFDKQYWYLIPLLLVISFFGSLVGKKLLNRIPQEKFKKLVLFLILGIGLILLYKESHHFNL